LESSIAIAKKSKSIIVRRTYKWFDPKASNEFSQIQRTFCRWNSHLNGYYDIFIPEMPQNRK
jgi:hypothetical protein